MLIVSLLISVSFYLIETLMPVLENIIFISYEIKHFMTKHNKTRSANLNHSWDVVCDQISIRTISYWRRAETVHTYNTLIHSPISKWLSYNGWDHLDLRQLVMRKQKFARHSEIGSQIYPFQIKSKHPVPNTTVYRNIITFIFFMPLISESKYRKKKILQQQPWEILPWKGYFGFHAHIFLCVLLWLYIQLLVIHKIYTDTVIGFCHWYWGNHMTIPEPVKESSRI